MQKQQLKQRQVSKFEQFVNMLVQKISGARAFIVLKKDGTWDYTGMPEDLFPSYISQPMTGFAEEHDSIPDERKDAWWTQ